jgi:recombination protein RecT
MSTAVAKRDQVQEACATIASPDFAAKLSQALPAGVSVERFTRVALTAVQQNPDVVVADRRSLFNSVIRCAQDGLLPDGREAALVVFMVKQKPVVQYLPMIGGLRKVAATHGISLTAYVVYANDEFEYVLGMAPAVTHRPAPLGTERGNPIGAYAVATDHRGHKYLDVMSHTEIEKVRAISKASTSQYGPWVNHWPEMARKTVGRRLFKQLPLGQLSESEGRIVRAADAGTDFGPDGRILTEEEGEVLTAVGDTFTPPDDEVETLDTADGEVVNEGGEEEQSAFPIPESARHGDNG